MCPMKFRNNSAQPLAIGSMIGILGGGQLGLMIGLEARAMGYKILCWQPNEECPLATIADIHEKRPFEDANALDFFCQSAHTCIIEFENIPIDIVKKISQFLPTYPNHEILEIAQQRHLEKQFFAQNNVPPAPNFYINSQNDLVDALNHIKLPAILKTNALGYDGKGQYAINTAQDYQIHAKPNHILEEKLNFDYEFSVLFARDNFGNIINYAPSLNHHERGIIRRASPILDYNPHIENIIGKLKILVANIELKGLLCVELFMMKNGDIYVNECAPRPHNSYHWTQNACYTNQFLQILRIAVNLPLGHHAVYVPCEMVNLIGEDILNVRSYLDNPYCFIHLYSKDSVKAGRKMGHVNIIYPQKNNS